MKKLRNVLIGALLVLPVLLLDASASAKENVAVGLSSTTSLTGTCWFFMNGRWYLLPC